MGRSQPQQPASDALPLICRQHQQLRDGAEKAAVCEDSQATRQLAAVPGSEVHRF